MKIMITGCRGQLGSELIACIKAGKSEIGILPQELAEATVIAVDIDELDITNNAAVSAFVSEKSPDVLINCAAMTNVDGCETMQDVAFKVNAMGVRNLARASEAVGAKFIHISTDYVFSGDGTTPYIECH